ncbi:hypothetical protein PHYSODRAFT_532945 [Phytophthora sojae]|uniref:Uncharacterized protein n=1 Tax=Phytophthora sojae (strain P6497) TaxID=1094619 RepID=G5AEY7_PHYSP|nr:hypothetical protein PHYSODRAFT_532945 [Phytophthora sojae]EGZ05777.1 hypothetical protein PHYSODRAFT_532945 [Phytophthora sojae]|eukprot:XP_009538638.1 hypothetical protein PHYSODRAFT_532945 [Phytophthora sojae]
MESLYARDTPTAHERKLKMAERDQQLKGGESSNQVQQQPTGTLESLVDTSTENGAATSGESASTTTNPADDAFGFSFNALSDTQQQLDDQWRTQGGELADKTQQDKQSEVKKTEEGRLAELSGEPTPNSAPASSNTDKSETKAAENTQQIASAPDPTTQQPRRAGVASVPRKPKPAITINTGSGSTGVGAKRPPPTPVSPPTFSWNDILREQANVDPAFANVVWQKLEEQNPTFFRAYSLQLQLKEQIIAFNYLVRDDLHREDFFLARSSSKKYFSVDICRSGSRRRWRRKVASVFCTTATRIGPQQVAPQLRAL